MLLVITVTLLLVVRVRSDARGAAGEPVDG
jgi:hypothetical protein